MIPKILAIGIFCSTGLALSLYAASLVIWPPKTICTSAECEAAAINLQQSMNLEVEPCDDFYEFACGTWPQHHPSLDDPPQSSSSTFDQRKDRNYEEILLFLKKPNELDEPKAVHKARKLFATCMDDKSFKASGRVYDIMSEIGVPALALAMDGNQGFDYVSAMAKMTRIGLQVFFNVEVQPNLYNRTENAIWLKRPSRGFARDVVPLMVNERIVKRQEDYLLLAFLNFIQTVRLKICPRHSNSSLCAQWNNQLHVSIYYNFNELKAITSEAKPQSPPTRIYMHSIEQLQSLTDDIARRVKSSIPKLDWVKYFHEVLSGLDVSVDLNDPSKVLVFVSDPNYLQNVLQFVLSKNVKEIELIFWSSMILTILPFTDSDLFDKKAILDLLSREKSCVSITTSKFGSAINYLHVKKDNYPKMKAEIIEIFENIKQSFEAVLKKVPWMDEITRNTSLNKLASLKAYLPHAEISDSPEKLDELYKDVDIHDDFFDTMIEGLQNQIKNNFNKLNEMNNLNEVDWSLFSDDVDVFYSCYHNAIFLPFGILGDPIYSRSLKAMDYGAVGQIMGHELMHGFDDVGGKYNEMGNRDDWWSDETSRRFEKKANCFRNAYNGYSTTFNEIHQKIPSERTINEDIADNIGFHVALSAYRKFVSRNGQETYLRRFEDLTHEQLFTLGFAKLWCEGLTQIDGILLAATDRHSPKPVRVNGALQNSKEFAKIWRCPEDSNMNPVDKCSLW